MAVISILSLLAWPLSLCCLYWHLCLQAEFPVCYTWTPHSSVMKMNFLSPSWVLVMPNTNPFYCLLVLFPTAHLQCICSWLHHYSKLSQNSCLTILCNFNIAWLTVKWQRGKLLCSRRCTLFSSLKPIKKQFLKISICFSTFITIWTPFLHLETLLSCFPGNHHLMCYFHIKQRWVTLHHFIGRVQQFISICI
jgi:hypothetical protein